MLTQSSVFTLFREEHARSTNGQAVKLLPKELPKILFVVRYQHANMKGPANPLSPALASFAPMTHRHWPLLHQATFDIYRARLITP